MKTPLIAPEEIERYNRTDAKLYILLAVTIAFVTGITWAFSMVAHGVDFQHVYMDLI